MVGVEVCRIELSRLLELQSGEVNLSQAHQVGRQVGSGGRGIRFQAYRSLQVRAGFRVLRLRGIDQSQQLVDVEALRKFAHQALQPLGGFGKVAGFILRYSGLELTLQTRFGASAASIDGTNANQSRETKGMNHSDRCRMITVFPCYTAPERAG